MLVGLICGRIIVDMFIFLYTVFRNSSISDEHVFCVALHFTTGYANFLLNDWFYFIRISPFGSCFTAITDTPFLLLAIACFSRSSKRFEKWLYHTKLYQIYVVDFRETDAIARERKRKILISIYILTGISIFFAPLIWVKFALTALTLFMTYYLFKVIPDKE